MRRATVGLIASLLLAAGCTGPDAETGIATAGGGGAAPSPSGTRDVVGEMRRWTQCLRDHGVDMPDPYFDPQAGKYVIPMVGPGKGEPGAEQGIAAQEACREYETWQEGFEQKPMPPEQLQLFREWAQCMRDHGVDVPDPDPNGGGGEDQPPARDPNNPGPPAALMEQAEAACMDKFLKARMWGVQ